MGYRLQRYIVPTLPSIHLLKTRASFRVYEEEVGTDTKIWLERLFWTYPFQVRIKACSCKNRAARRFGAMASSPYGLRRDPFLQSTPRISHARWLRGPRACNLSGARRRRWRRRRYLRRIARRWGWRLRRRRRWVVRIRGGMVRRVLGRRHPRRRRGRRHGSLIPSLTAHGLSQLFTPVYNVPS